MLDESDQVHQNVTVNTSVSQNNPTTRTTSTAFVPVKPGKITFKSFVRIQGFQEGDATIHISIMKWDNTFNSASHASIIHYIEADKDGEYMMEYEYDIPQSEVDNNWKYYIQLRPSVSDAILLDILPGSYFEGVIEENASIGDLVDMALGLPDISQKDFLKAIAQQFNVLFQADTITNTVELRQFKDIPANKINAYDWSDKLDLSRLVTIKYRYNSYAQNNYMKYREEDGIEELGMGTIIVNDHTMTLEADLFELPFAASEHVNVLNDVECARLKRWVLEGSTWEASEESEPKILAVRRQEKTIHITGGTTPSQEFSGSAPVAYFSNANLDLSLDFEALRQKNYEDIESILKKTKVVKAYFYLSENDVQSLDFFRPVYVKKFSNYFYINKVEEFLDGYTTPVELVRL